MRDRPLTPDDERLICGHWEGQGCDCYCESCECLNDTDFSDICSVCIARNQEQCGHLDYIDTLTGKVCQYCGFELEEEE